MFCLNLLYQKKVKIGTYRLPASQEIVTKKNHCQTKKIPNTKNWGVLWCVSIILSRSHGAETPPNSTKTSCSSAKTLSWASSSSRYTTSAPDAQKNDRDVQTRMVWTPPNQHCQGWDGLPGCPEARSWLITVSPPKDRIWSCSPSKWPICMAYKWGLLSDHHLLHPGMNLQGNGGSWNKHKSTTLQLPGTPKI